MSYFGLTRDNNLSDLSNANEAWTNLADGLSYSYGAVRANYVVNSAVIAQTDKSNVVVSAASGVALSYGSQYVYQITERAGVAIPFPFAYLRAANTGTSYTNLERRLNVANGPIVGSILLKAGSHSCVGMATRPANGGAFFKDTNYPFLGIDLRTGQFQDAFSNKKNYELMGVYEEDDGWWRVSMSSICQQDYGTAAIDLIFLQQGNLAVLPNASSTDGSKFFYAALPQIELGHEPSPVIITVNDQPIARQTVASSFATLNFTGDDVAAIAGLSEVGSQNLLQIKTLLNPAQPRLTGLQASGQAMTASGANLLSTSSPSSSGNYFLSGLVASGYRVGGNPIGSVSGSPFSGGTALVPLRVGPLVPQSWKVNTVFASGTLANPTVAIPIEYNGFYVTIVAGQS